MSLQPIQLSQHICDEPVFVAGHVFSAGYHLQEHDRRERGIWVSRVAQSPRPKKHLGLAPGFSWELPEDSSDFEGCSASCIPLGQRREFPHLARIGNGRITATHVAPSKGNSFSDGGLAW